MFGLGAILGLGKFTGIVGKIIEFAPIAIDVVERLFGRGDGAKKKAAAAKEVLEFVRELLDRGEEFGGFDEELQLDPDAVLLALEDEGQFVDKIVALNDAIVDLTNYVNSFKEENEFADKD